MDKVVHTSDSTSDRRLCRIAAELEGSRILAIAADVQSMKAEGQPVFNFTVGDFDAQQFPIPEYLRDRIIHYYREGQTNYPPAAGMPQLRQAVSEFYREWLDLSYAPENIVVGSGARPLIYAAFRTLLDPGDKVLYPVPSWNNHYYIYLNSATGIPIESRVEDDFLPAAEGLEAHLSDARVLCLNTPMNPTGTVFSREELERIAQAVLTENQRRGPDKRPLYILYDYIYWMLVFGDSVAYHPVQLLPELEPYVVAVDGLSKAFAATGVRLGWATGPADIIKKMVPLIGHMGSWSPKPEQLATADWLGEVKELRTYHAAMKERVETRLNRLYEGIQRLAEVGKPVRAIRPMGAIYLSVFFDLAGRHGSNGQALDTTEDIRRYLLKEASVAVVPFEAFGYSGSAGWCRFSVGAVSLDDIEQALGRLESCLP